MRLLVVFGILLSITSCGIIAEKINTTKTGGLISHTNSGENLSQDETEILEQLDTIVNKIENISYNVFSVEKNNIQKYLTSEDNSQTDFYTNSEFGDHVVMIPGLGLSHSIYMNTPDNRKSFFEYFSDAGFLVSVMNPATNVSKITENTKMWDSNKIWSRWGFGYEKDNAYKNTQFPVENIDTFYKQLPNYGAETIIPENEVLKDYLTDTGSAYIMFHSAAGKWVYDFAKNNPDLVKGLIAIEPVGCPKTLENTPNEKFLAVYGDFIESRNQTSRYNACVQTYQFSKKLGNSESEFIDLPALGIKGNSHLLMQDKNNGDIAQKIINWIQK